MGVGAAGGDGSSGVWPVLQIERIWRAKMPRAARTSSKLAAASRRASASTVTTRASKPTLAQSPHQSACGKTRCWRYFFAGNGQLKRLAQHRLHVWSRIFGVIIALRLKAGNEEASMASTWAKIGAARYLDEAVMLLAVSRIEKSAKVAPTIGRRHRRRRMAGLLMAK